MSKDRLRPALELLRTWMTSSKRPLWPQEQTLQAWTAMALVEEGYCKPREVLLEVSFGEREVPDPDRDDWREHRIKNVKYMQFDLTILTGPPQSEARDFFSCVPHPKLIVEIKSLNSAGTLRRAAIRIDMWKLWFARQWWTARGKDVEVLMLVLATDTKDAEVEKDRAKRQKVRDWIMGFDGDKRAPPNVRVALLPRDEAVIVTEGHAGT